MITPTICACEDCGSVRVVAAEDLGGGYYWCEDCTDLVLVTVKEVVQ